MRRRSLEVIGVVGVLAATGAIAFAFGNASQSAAATAPNMSGVSLQDAFVSVYSQVSPSVVQIETRDGLGSGIVFDDRGDIVTNAHVVGNSTTFRITTPAGKILSGKLVGVFKEDDLAVVRASGGSLHPASFGNSDALRVGDIAMAIGNPLGLQSSFTEGVVSALDRDESEGNGVTLRNAIQTSAAINPGNSGGALVDITGKVIGIPTLAANDPQLGGAAAGIGFAIPGNDVLDYAHQMVAHGKVIDTHRAYLGVTIEQTNAGVYIGTVTSDGPASKAGLKVGDVITAVEGKTTQSEDALGAALASRKPGQTVTLSITRQDGSKKTARVTLGQFPGG
jgi:putative serine protease PepD